MDVLQPVFLESGAKTCFLESVGEECRWKGEPVGGSTQHEATENLRTGKRGKVREQFDLFVVAQKAQPCLCYHKKVRQKENL